MKCLPLKIFAFATLCLVALSTGQAQTTVTTDPVGFTTVTVAGSGVAGQNSYTLLALDLTRPVDYAGVIPVSAVTVVGGTTVLTFPSNTFTAAQFTGSANSHYIEITSGSGAGAMSTIVANDDHSISLADDLSAIIDNTGGTTTFKTRPHWTLSAIFGANNSAGFQGSYNTTSADLIQVLNPLTKGLVAYYYSTTNNRWQAQVGNVDATNTPINPETGLLIVRKQPSSINVTLQGNVKIGSTGFYIAGGNGTVSSIIPNPYPLSSVTLANSGLITGNAVTGLVGSFSAANADLVQTLSSTGQLTAYYYNTTSSQWVTQVGNNPASTVTFGDTVALLVTRKSSRPSFTWYAPQPTMGL